jgi:hypothetical protein
MSVVVVHAQLVYDPLTNSYKPKTTTWSTSTTSSTGSKVTTGSVTSTWSTSTGQTVVSSIPKTQTWTTSVSTSPYVIPNPTLYKWTLSAMHIQLDKHTKTVMDKLYTHMANLDISKSESLKEASQRLRILVCLGIVPPDNNIYDMLQKSADNLHKSIAIVSTDIHGSIGALEEKMNQWLLDTLVQQLEVSSMQNKVDSFLTEYTNIVDLFFEVSIGKVEDIEKLFTNLSVEEQKSLTAYTKNNEAYSSVMKAYENFLGKSSFSNIVAAPNMHELIKLNNGLKTYRRSVLLNERQKKIGQYAPLRSVTTVNSLNTSLIQDFSLLFNEKTQSVLWNIYPIEEILLLNQQIMGIRTAYTDENNWFQDCRAFVENPTVATTWPELEKYMQTLLTDLNSAVNKIATNNTLPKTKEELMSGLKKQLMSDGEKIVADLIKNYKTKTQELLTKEWSELMSIPNPANSLAKIETSVRTYLQKKYLEALEKNILPSFQEKLASINTKIEKRLASDQLSKSQTKLMILLQTIINEFVTF